MSMALIFDDLATTLFENSEYVEGLLDVLDDEMIEVFEAWGTMSGSQILSSVMKDPEARNALAKLLEKIGKAGAKVVQEDQEDF